MNAGFTYINYMGLVALDFTCMLIQLKTFFKRMTVVVLVIFFFAHFSGTMVQFSNRLGGAIKQDVEERSNGAFDGR